jgi:hypothetical protein
MSLAAAAVRRQQAATTESQALRHRIPRGGGMTEADDNDDEAACTPSHRLHSGFVTRKVYRYNDHGGQGGAKKTKQKSSIGPPFPLWEEGGLARLEGGGHWGLLSGTANQFKSSDFLPPRL